MKTKFLVIAISFIKIISAQKVDTVFLFQKPGQKIFIEPTENIEQYEKLTNFYLDDTSNFHNFTENLESLLNREG